MEEKIKKDSIAKSKPTAKTTKKTNSSSKPKSTSSKSKTTNSSIKTSATKSSFVEPQVEKVETVETVETNKKPLNHKELLDKYGGSSKPAKVFSSFSKLKILLFTIIPTILISVIVAVSIFVIKNRYINVIEIAFKESYVEVEKENEDNIVLNFPAIVSPVNATNKKVIYTSSNTSIATVTEQGTITFYNFGLVTITAQSEENLNISTECTFLVTDDEVHYLEILNSKHNMLIGEYFNLQTKITPNEAVDKTITYTSSNQSAVMVSYNGKVLAVGGGQSTITATTSNGISASFDIFVTVPVTEFYIENQQQSLVTSKTNLSFPNIIVEPSTATNKKINYTSSNKNIATIDDKGNITFLKQGEVVFTATSDYDKTKKVEYTVRSTCGAFDYCNIKESSQNININYAENGLINFELDYSPLDIDLMSIVITSSNEDAVKVENNQLYIVGGGQSTIRIKFNTLNGAVEKTANIFVNRDVESITASDMEFTTSSQNILYSILPLDHTNTITITSQSPIINISYKDYVTFLYPGTAQITITSSNGVSKTITISYHTADEIVSVEENTQEVSVDYLDDFYFDFSKLNYGEVTFSDYDESILTYNNFNHTFSAIKGGRTNITATSNQLSTTFSVLVVRPAESITASDMTFTSISQDLEYTVLPLDHTNSVSLSSSSPLINITENKTITFVYPGSAEVLISTDNGVTKSVVVSYSTCQNVVNITEDLQNINVDYQDEFFLDFASLNFGQINFLNYDNSVLSYNSSTFTFTAIKGGSTNITVKASNTTLTLKVFVTRLAESIVAEDMQVNTYAGQVSYTILPLDHTNSVTIESGSNIMTLAEDGHFTFAYAGTGQITISTDNGLTKTISVTFMPTDKLISVNSNEQNITLNYLDKFYLTFEAFNFSHVEFSNFDSSILEYNQATHGFSAIKGGETTLTVNGDSTILTLNFKVIRKVESFDLSTQDVTLAENQATTAKTQIQFNSSNFMPLDCTVKTATYSVDNDSIASVTQSGLLTFKKEGTVVLTAKADNVSKTVSITSTYGLPINFDITSSQYVFEDVNQNFQIELANFEPSDYIFDITHFTFTSKDTSVVSVDSQGYVTSVGKGNTSISVTVGKATKEIALEVKVKTTSVAFTYNNELVDSGNVAGNTIQLGSKALPENANNKEVSYQVVSGEANIDNSGLLTFAKDGSVVVRVTTLDSGVYEDITLTKIDDNNVLRIYNDDTTNLDNYSYTIQADEHLTPEVKVECVENIINSDVFNLNNIIVEYENENDLIVSPSSVNNGEYVFTRTFTTQKKSDSRIIFNLNGIRRSFTCTFLNLLGLSLEYKNTDDINYGPEQKRVFGTNSFINGSLVNYILVPVIKNPVNNEDEVSYFVEDEEIAYIENGNLVVRSSSFEGEIKTTITVGDQEVERDCKYLSSYEFTLISGCNIYNTAGYDYCVTNYSDKHTAITMVFQANLGTQQEQTERPNQAFDSFTSTNWAVFNAIVGNGYILNLNYNGTSKAGPIFHNDIRNLYIRGRDRYTDNSKYYIDMCLGTMSMEYCDIRYISKVWIGNYTESSEKNDNGFYETFIKNVYVGHCRSNAIHFKQASYNLFIENVVFEDVGMAAICYDKGNLYIKGFCDVKNFVGASNYPDYESVISGLIEPVSQDETFKPFVLTDTDTNADGTIDKNDYKINLAIGTFATGLTSATPTVSSVKFYDNSSSQYVDVGKGLAGVDNGTGLDYKFLTYSTRVFLKITVYAWSIPIENLHYLDEVNVNKIYRLYEI